MAGFAFSDEGSSPTSTELVILHICDGMMFYQSLAAAKQCTPSSASTVELRPHPGWSLWNCHDRSSQIFFHCVKSGWCKRRVGARLSRLIIFLMCLSLPVSTNDSIRSSSSIPPLEVTSCPLSAIAWETTSARKYD